MTLFTNWKRAAVLGFALLFGVAAVAGHLQRTNWSADVRAIELNSPGDQRPASPPDEPGTADEVLKRLDDDADDDDARDDDDDGVDLTNSGDSVSRDQIGGNSGDADSRSVEAASIGDGDRTAGDDGTSGGNNTAASRSADGSSPNATADSLSADDNSNSRGGSTG
ncbi:MAG TPA: hypothetical protein VNW68_04380 [Candidatus Limnocylindria bacterium]|nr:hypothetical protein [Candidatus Limnocylindria bacterium]